ncbi:hypothetical protein GN157_08760 [Flavobacterium rakeshii]|uniref:DUF4397 domain-containing protein n=1 Tax=Flavobacterium rakeshii TaxID=1038845 RepID=A0A6N8HEN5_9FLAO|nr:hypothetical protein [Flavobacterium rakeshii]MUV03797.1 hypothetical protein [Flavobacterium rakeshii]
MRKNHYLLLLLSLFIISCSNDDDSNGSQVNNAIPLSTGNYWVYDVNVAGTTGRDSLYIANDTVINAITYKKFKTKDFPIGFYSIALNNNALRNVDGKILLSGGIDTGIPEIPVDLTVSDFVVFDPNAVTGSILSTFNGQNEQELEGFDVNISYALTAEAGDNYTSYSTPDGQSYNNVKAVEVKLSLKVAVTIPDVPIPFTILPTQDVLISTQYYANGIGMIHTVTDMQYELADTFGIELPLPQSFEEHQEEALSVYNIQ